MQLLVTKLNQLGNGIGVTAGSANNNQTVWSEFMETLNKVVNDLQAGLQGATAEVQRLTTENAKLRAIAEQKLPSA